MGVPVPPDDTTAAGEYPVDGSCVRREDGRDKDVAADEVLGVDAEELLLVWELEEQRADGRRSPCGRLREERVL